MKHLLTLLVAFTLTLQHTAAQNLKFGKPSKEEWDLTSCPESPDAPAVVLCKNLSVVYSLSASFSSYSGGESELNAEGASLGTNNLLTSEGTSLTYTVKMRTKILKEEGRDYANLDILYYYSNKDMNQRDDFYSFKVTLFSMVNGKVKKQNLDKSSYKDEQITNDYMIRHVRIPQAQVGDIIEVQYELFSGRAAYIFDWQFQDEIPVQYSLAELNIPSFLTFNVNAAIRDNIKSSVERGTVFYKKESTDLMAPKTAFSNMYRIESRNMLPWSLDPVSKKPNSAIAQLKCTIANTTVRGIPYPMSQPEGMNWITLAPKK